MQLLIKTGLNVLLWLALATAAGVAAPSAAAGPQQQASGQQAEPEPSAEQEPPAGKEPSTGQAPSAEQESSAGQESSAEQKPSAEQEPSAGNEPSAEPRQGVPFQRQDPPAARSPNSGISLTKIAISLAAVLLLVVALGWLFKKLTLRLPGSQHVKVICSVPLGQRERLLVIEIQGKQRVLGVTPQSINMLFELENSLPETKLASDFHTQLQSFLKK
ncbi:flagellar biosynthetic protein FliO [Arsukibacterium sp.]|uniref:flagellar biosynthetic protein FliO n=1 Tax=Arsukibacterium sp. TaxID=1977258 RepID=UPI001BD43D12|nr:flagellar biosynthetic protein FliO [Arsukibacterium sp.]